MSSEPSRAQADAAPTVLATVRINRTILKLDGWRLRLWIGGKAMLALAALGVMAAGFVAPGWSIPNGLRIVVTLLVLWGFLDQVARRRRAGRSFILLTTRGLLSTTDNLYVDWDQIETFRSTSRAAYCRINPAAREDSLFAAAEVEIPLTDASRPVILGILQTRIDGRRAASG